ncbi:MAG: EAL domain-containing protein [Deltaproteobacteria bacterium]|nr:EAL domain-containing protein [Deltaproteobacteria bacterium]MBF0508497.1 EAL domain-containing protein [Deltaproteobacteria bacterium]
MSFGRPLDIGRMIDTESIVTHFQPIVSVKTRSVIGFEALSRGIDLDTGQIIPPMPIIRRAREQHLTIELDRVFRKKAMNTFKSRIAGDDRYTLFINIDTSILDQNVVGSGQIINLVDQLGLSPKNIVIEIVESQANDIHALKQFIDNHRRHGFSIALDDLGNGFSNLDRIPIIKPDILKLDRWLIQNIDEDFYKQEVFRSVVNLAKKIGALVVAEGVERREEVVWSLELGADILQGYYFSSPQALNGRLLNGLKDRINHTAVEYKSYIIEKIKKKRLEYESYNCIINNLINELSKTDINRINQQLLDVLENNAVVECIYILDEMGIQVTSTICNDPGLPVKNNLIFQPARPGTDHSTKEFYYLLVNTGFTRYVTEPYISLATGNLCVTISVLFTNVDQRQFILCADFIT